MPNLTYPQQIERDQLTLQFVRMAVDALARADMRGETEPFFGVFDEEIFEESLKDKGLSDEARKQVTTEVQKVLKLLARLSKARVH